MEIEGNALKLGRRKSFEKKFFLIPIESAQIHTRNIILMCISLFPPPHRLSLPPFIPLRSPLP